MNTVAHQQLRSVLAAEVQLGAEARATKAKCDETLEYLRNVLYQFLLGKHPEVTHRICADVSRFCA